MSSKKVSELFDGCEAGDVAVALNVEEVTLRNWRSAGKGPPWFRAGNKFIYPIAGLREWAQAKTVFPSPRTPTLADAPRRPGRPRKQPQAPAAPRRRGRPRKQQQAAA